MNAMTKAVLWDRLVRKVTRLKDEIPHTGHTQRSQGWTDASQEKMQVTLSLSQEDGTSRVFVLTAVVGSTNVIVKEYQDNHDEFWLEQLKYPQNAIVIDGEHYRIGPEGATCKGFEGRRFDLRNLSTSATIGTTNLSYQGKIPPKYRCLLPDTYEFVKE